MCRIDLLQLTLDEIEALADDGDGAALRLLEEWGII